MGFSYLTKERIIMRFVLSVFLVLFVIGGTYTFALSDNGDKDAAKEYKELRAKLNNQSSKRMFFHSINLIKIVIQRSVGIRNHQLLVGILPAQVLIGLNIPEQFSRVLCE